MVKKYYIVKVDTRTGSVEYKRYKCIDGWSKNEASCWQFSRTGAWKIVERLAYEYRYNPNIVFTMKEATFNEV